jgi:glyoxylase-like metal-dependent hydrolase (beta-lactamase superfamily II)
MKISTIPTGYFKLDGGAMFGIVPKRLWQKLNPPDENNLCTWALRCLLIETDDRKILVDTGIGNKQDARWQSFFEPHGKETLLDSLSQKGIRAEDVTDVFHTHLHFDHCGGSVSAGSDGAFVPTFPNAVYWSNEKHWNWAVSPNERERASFLKENFLPLKEAEVLRFLDVKDGMTTWLPGLDVEFVYGHTEAMMLLHIETGKHHFVYCADLLPSVHHLGIPYIMAYDIRPLVTLEEKEALLRKAAEKNWLLLFEHDPVNACASVMYDERGRIVAKEMWKNLPG